MEAVNSNCFTTVVDEFCDQVMKAVVITRFGGPEVLEIQDVPQPQPGPEEVLVHVRSTALNRADLLQRLGRYPAPPGAAQNIPGLEFAGEVAELGTNADRWQKGNRVMGIAGGGAHAEFVTAHQDAVAAVPPNLEWSAAGGVPEVFITAHDALQQAGFKAGENVLIHAVGSGVGLAATQLASALGGTCLWHFTYARQSRARESIWFGVGICSSGAERVSGAFCFCEERDRRQRI